MTVSCLGQGGKEIISVKQLCESNLSETMKQQKIFPYIGKPELRVDSS